MRRSAEKQRPCPFVVEPPCDARGGKDTPQRKTPCNRRLWCQAPEGSQKDGRKLDCRAEQPRIFLSQLVGVVAADEECGAVVEGVRQRGRRLDPLDVEIERVEERGCDRERMDRGAHVVTESRKCQLRRARSTADCFPRFEDEDGTFRLRERDRGREPVRPGADDDCV